MHGLVEKLPSGHVSGQLFGPIRSGFLPSALFGTWLGCQNKISHSLCGAQ